MTEYLQNVADNSQWPVLTAFALGLLTALSPCPLATNIAAAAYVSKTITNRNRAFANGFLYALGRIVAYSVLGIVLIEILNFGGDTYGVQKFIMRHGEQILPVFLMLCGAAIIFAHKLKFSGIPTFAFAEKIKGDGLGAFALGFVFALAFCPTSAMFFFAVLIPICASCFYGEALPAVFGTATALPVMIISAMLAYGIDNVGKFYGKAATFEKWLRFAVGALFAAVGLYYFTTMYIL